MFLSLQVVPKLSGHTLYGKTCNFHDCFIYMRKITVFNYKIRISVMYKVGTFNFLVKDSIQKMFLLLQVVPKLSGHTLYGKHAISMIVSYI